MLKAISAAAGRPAYLTAARKRERVREDGLPNLAVLVGGGLDIPLKHRLAVRPIQADYGLTHLPNNSNNNQNLLRLSAGLVVRIR